MPSREQTNASILLATAWGALAVTFGAYALVRDSIGALVIALVLVWLMRLAWAFAWRAEGGESSSRPDVPFRF